jgi:hypothetical protein
MSGIYVYAGTEEAPQLVGLAYVEQRRGRLASTFAYAQEYLSDRYSTSTQTPTLAPNARQRSRAIRTPKAA